MLKERARRRASYVYVCMQTVFYEVKVHWLFVWREREEATEEIQQRNKSKKFGISTRRQLIDNSNSVV